MASKKKGLGAKKLTTDTSSPSAGDGEGPSAGPRSVDLRIESFEHMEKRAARAAAEKEDHEVRGI